MARDDSKFDFQKALKAIQSGKPLTGKDGVLTPLIKNLGGSSPRRGVRLSPRTGDSCQPQKWQE